MSGFSVKDLRDGIPIYGIETLTYSSSINLKAFYTEMAATFAKEDCKDTLNLGYYAKDGQMVGEAKEEKNRTGNMFEEKFFWNDVGGAHELELVFKAKRNTIHISGGHVVFEMDLVCRRIVDKEILEGNNKKVVQEGSWEFRNKIKYYNHTLANTCDKFGKFVPFYGKKAPEMILKAFYGHLLHDDIHYAKHKVVPIMMNVIKKHFG